MRISVTGLLLVATLGIVPIIHAGTVQRRLGDRPKGFGDSPRSGTVPLGERIAEEFRARGLTPELVVVAVSMLPIVELRGAVPIGNNLFHLPLWKTLLLSIVGNMIPLFLVVLLLERVVALLGRIPIFKRFFDWLFKRTRGRSGTIAKYEFWGLVLFVGIPLPGTGGWTGSVAAVAMGMPYWRSLLAIFIGVLMAAAIVTLLCLLGIWGAVIAGVAVAVVLVQAVIAGLRRRRAAHAAP